MLSPAIRQDQRLHPEVGGTTGWAWQSGRSLTMLPCWANLSGQTGPPAVSCSCVQMEVYAMFGTTAYASWLSGFMSWALYLGEITNCVQQEDRDTGWASRLPRVTVQTSWLCGKRGCAQWLTADFALCPSKAIRWAVQLPGFSGQASYSGGTRSYVLQERQIASLPGCGHRTDSMANRGHLLKFPNLAKPPTELHGQMESPAGLCRATGQDLCQGTTASRNTAHQAMSSGCYTTYYISVVFQKLAKFAF